MPAIKKDDKQLIALQEVSDSLALVKLINAAMDTPQYAVDHDAGGREAHQAGHPH